jgi:hypothetical protein
MHRLFSLFPSGLPGIGLIALRLVVVICLCPVFSVLALWFGSAASAWIQTAMAIATVAGLLTPVSAVIYLVLASAELWSHGHATDTGYILAALSLMLLGPGAYSVDAHLYGHRAVVVRRRH